MTFRIDTIATTRKPGIESEALAPTMMHESDRPNPENLMPMLLVSARNLREAITAARAGADLIDLKEPAHGALGRCDETIWQAVAEKLRGMKPLSAALGEWDEWDRLDDERVQEILTMLEGFDFAKIGPCGSAMDDGAGLKRAYDRLRSLGPKGLRWIAVVYADQERAGALPRQRILDMARNCGFQGILIDTFDKSRPHFWGPVWSRFVQNSIDEGMLVAIAGGLTIKNIRLFGDMEPHWFAVRGAACARGERNGQVSYRRVMKLARSLERR